MIKLYRKERRAWGEMSNGEILCEIPFESLIFPGGEPHVQINPVAVKGYHTLIDARIHSMNELMTMLVLVNTLKHARALQPSLFIPYFPGARQDRVTSPGSPFTAKLFAELINQQNFANVFLLDPHSSVTPALVDNHVILPLDILFQDALFNKYKYSGIIAPDAGSTNRAEIAAKIFKLPFIQGKKHRNPETGKLSGFSCEFLPLPLTLANKRRFLIVDDICDGGGTFIGLIKSGYLIIQNHEYDLFVTHGIFSKGTDELLDHIEDIITTDSFHNPSEDFVYLGRLNSIPLFQTYQHTFLQYM